MKFEQLFKSTKAYNTVMNDLKNNTLSHCYMIVSEDGIACDGICELIARGLLCENNNCGECSNCTMFKNRVHPALIEPEDLKMEGIKTLIEDCSYSFDYERKIVLIKNFQDIQYNVQNVLLKSIEEPNEGIVFILGVKSISNVLDTIKSRSKKIQIDKFNLEDIKRLLIEDEYDLDMINSALSFAEGSLEKAYSMVEGSDFLDAYKLMIDILVNIKTSKEVLNMLDKMNIKRVDRDDALVYLDAYETILKQILEYKMGVNYNVDGNICFLAQKFDISTIVNVEDLIIESRKKIEQYCQVDAVIESLFIKTLEVKYICQQ